jgi:hypothetical protein
MPSTFVECYAKYIDFCYEIFDRILLKGYIPLAHEGVHSAGRALCGRETGTGGECGAWRE